MTPPTHPPTHPPGRLAIPSPFQQVLQLGNDPEVHAAFLHEASVLWHLRHKNVVNLSGVVVHGSEGYLLMVRGAKESLAGSGASWSLGREPEWAGLPAHDPLWVGPGLKLLGGQVARKRLAEVVVTRVPRCAALCRS